MSVLVLHPEAAGSMGLAAALDHLDRHLDARSEASILAAAPVLAALARNRRFLADFVAETLASRHFQHDNRYTARVVILGGGQHYLLRAVEWFPTGEPTPPEPVFEPGSDSRDFLDQSLYGLAHSHSFALLTVCYWGSGYETDIYEIDPAAIRAGGERLHTRVELRAAGRYRLTGDTVLFYPAHRVAHVQHPPASYAITLNLIVRSEEDRTRNQYYFDLRRSTLAGVAGGPAVGHAEPWIYLLSVAGRLGDRRFAPALDAIARCSSHTRLRAHAAACGRRVSVDAESRD